MFASSSSSSSSSSMLPHARHVSHPRHRCESSSSSSSIGSSTRSSKPSFSRREALSQLKSSSRGVVKSTDKNWHRRCDGIRTTAANEGGETDAFSFSLDSQSASEKKLNLVTNGVRLKSVLKLVSVLTLAGWFMRFAHDPSSTVLPITLKRMSVSTLLGVLLAFIGYKKKSLDFSGAIFASLVGVVTIFSGVRFGLTLAFFFFSGSAVTKVQGDVKRRVDEHFKEGGGLRDFVQVMANGLVPTLLAAASLYSLGGLSFIVDNVGGEFAETIISIGNSSSDGATKVASAFAVAFLSYFSCCGGDTFASELGVLSKSKPRLITTFCRKEVEPGTNGGVSILGVFASILGGLVAASGWALGAFITFGTQIEILLALGIGAVGGLFGSFVDSVLGATIQYSGYCSERKKVVSKPGPTVTKISGLEILSNSGVNVVSASFIAFAFGAAFYYFIL